MIHVQILCKNYKTLMIVTKEDLERYTEFIVYILILLKSMDDEFKGMSIKAPNNIFLVEIGKMILKYIFKWKDLQ